MKLLFDQNLSPSLVIKLLEHCPGSTHVADVGLSKAIDHHVWDFAKKYQRIIITKDADFSDFVEMKGYPPKLVWIRKENCSTQVIEILLKDNLVNILAFEQDSDRGVLV